MIPQSIKVKYGTRSNPKRKFRNQMEKSKAQTHQKNG